MSEINNRNGFYYVVCDNSEICTNDDRLTFDSAYKEAIRLAKATGKKHLVMKTMIRVVPTQNIVVEDARP